jgi:hypothetical protein
MATAMVTETAMAMATVSRYHNDDETIRDWLVARGKHMGEVKICAVCKHENVVEAETCANCGAPLSSDVTTTLSVSGQLAEVVRQDPNIRRTTLPAGSIALYVMGEKLPLVVEGKGQPTILGRLGQDSPTSGIVDLTKYQAHLLGVSRQHAAISFKENSFAIEDLNSSNGTWVNENRLAPNQPRVLRNGDVIRLGQLIIFVYLH